MIYRRESRCQGVESGGCLVDEYWTDPVACEECQALDHAVEECPERVLQFDNPGDGEMSYRGWIIAWSFGSCWPGPWSFEVADYDGAPDSRTRNMCGYEPTIGRALAAIDEQIELNR